MYYIIGDIGNTSTRICLLNKSKILKSIIFDTKNIFLKGYFKKILNKFFHKKLNKDILFSSVVPLAFKKIKKNFKTSNFTIYEIKKFNLKKIIKINIRNIKQLGSDRIVNSIEGKKFRNCLINKSKILKSTIFDTKNIFLKGYIKKILNKFFHKRLKKEILFSSVVPSAFKKIKKNFKTSSFTIYEIK